MAIPSEIRLYVDELLALVGELAESLWLFGSRANGTNRTDSDWDLLLFSNDDGFQKINQAKSLRRENIDLLVAVNENWLSPWADDKTKQKELSAAVLNWEIVGIGRACYLGRPKYKNLQEWWKESNSPQDTLCAYQIWP